MVRRLQTPESFADMVFPLEGLEKTRAFNKQRQNTTPSCMNVRAFDPLTGRARGGMRPGLAKYMAGQVNGSLAIQDINFLVTNDAGTAPTTTAGQFPASLGASNGFSLRNPDGTAIGTLAANASYQFACSCWDRAGNLYVAQINTATGGMVLSAHSPTGATLWTVIPPVAASTGSLRYVAGMAVAGPYLFIARGTGTASSIDRFIKSNGTLDSYTWQTYNATTQFLQFSANAVNVLAAIETVDTSGNVTAAILGVASYGNGVSSQGFRTYNALQGSGYAALTFTAWGGTPNQSPTKVVTDGISTFYCIADVLVNKLKSISSAGVVSTTFSTTMADTNVTGLAYDKYGGRLLVTFSAATSLRTATLTTGAQITTTNPGGITSWSNVDTDGNGNITLWANGVANNDTIGLNTALATAWGPTTVANTTHTGASVNKTIPTVATPSGASRQIRGLVVAGGLLKRFSSAGVVSVTTGQKFSTLATTVFSAQNGLRMFYADGAGYFYYDSATDAVVAWTPSAGTLPVDAKGQKARLICTYNGRTVLSGLLNDPGNWFMSKQSNPLDFNYSPATTTVQQAVAGNVSKLGLIGDYITCLIPYQDDTLIFGCVSSIWMLQGDPQNGGQIVRVSGELGMAWGRPYCIDPYGQIYFFGSKCGLFKMTPGALPVRVSQQIEKDVESVDFSKNLIRMEWDMQAQGMHVWITPIALPAGAPTTGGSLITGTSALPPLPAGTTTHYFYEERTNAWFPFTYGNANHSPFATRAYDGDDPNERVILLGGRDGYIRMVSNSAATDDGNTISSYVVIGPLRTKQEDDIIFKDMSATLSSGTTSVQYDVYVGDSAEKALNSTPVATGTWGPDRNPLSYVRRSGYAVFVKISSSTAWALERLTTRYAAQGKVRRRSGVR